MINVDTIEQDLQEAFALFKNLLIETTSKNHYVELPYEVKQRRSNITDKYIIKRFTSIIEDCPYPIKIVTYENDGWDRAGKAIRGVNKYIELSDSDPTTIQFETLLHEWAHHILHLRRNAVKQDEFIEELEAETVSFVVGFVMGHVDELAHFYILCKYDEYSIAKENRLKTLTNALRKSEPRIIRAANQILKKMSWTLEQINYHHKKEGKRLDY